MGNLLASEKISQIDFGCPCPKLKKRKIAQNINALKVLMLAITMQNFLWRYK